MLNSLQLFHLLPLPYTFGIAECKTIAALCFKLLFVLFSVLLASPFQLIALVLLVMLNSLQLFHLLPLPYTFGIAECKTITTSIFKLLFVVFSVLLAGPFQLVALVFFHVFLSFHLFVQLPNATRVTISKGKTFSPSFSLCLCTFPERQTAFVSIFYHSFVLFNARHLHFMLTLLLILPQPCSCVH